MSHSDCIALLGDFSNERISVNTVGKEFQWSVYATRGLSELQDVAQHRRVAAVLVNVRTFDVPWNEILCLVSRVAPSARIVLCHGFQESHLRGEMTASGAFQTLALPLSHSEVRQALGFVWAHSQERRSMAGGQVVEFQPACVA